MDKIPQKRLNDFRLSIGVDAEVCTIGIRSCTALENSDDISSITSSETARTITSLVEDPIAVGYQAKPIGHLNAGIKSQPF